MQHADLKRPRFYIPISLIVLLAVLSAVVFNPAFQKKMLLKHLGPLVDSLQLEYVHFTPWSLQLDKVEVDYEGGHFALERGTLRYCISSLLLLNANIKTIALHNISVDVSDFSPPEAPEAQEPDSHAIFSGVLASLQHGLSYSLQEVDINADVLLPEQQSLSISMTGGEIRPKATGALNIKAQYHTGKEDELVALDGDLVLDQLTRGRFKAIDFILAIDAMLATLPEAESVSLKMRVTPAPFTEAEQLSAEASGEEPELVPEALHLAMEQHDSDGQQRSEFMVDGRYDGNSGNFDGAYRATANERLVQRYIKDTEIPPTVEELSGELLFNIAETTGDITVISELLMKEIDEIHANENLPAVLRLENNFRVSLLPGLRLHVETIYSGLTDEDATQPLASSLPEDLDIPLQDIESFMHQENVLLVFELPEVPLAWFDIFLPEHEITEGTLAGAFEITTDTAGSIHIMPVNPLTVTGFTLMQEGKLVLDGINLSVLPHVTYRGDALDVSLDELLLDGGKGTVATAGIAATVPLGEEPGAIDIRATADLALHRLVEMLAIEQTGKQSLPDKLSMIFQAAIQQQPDAVHVTTLDAQLLMEKTRLLHLELLQPLVMVNTEEGTRIGNTEGKLATFNISNLQLDWFSAFVPNTTLKGELQRADFALATDASGVATLAATKPVRLNNVTITDSAGEVLKDVDISVRPSIHLAPEGTRVSYEDLTVSGQKTRLLAANGTVTFPGAQNKPLLAEGHLELNVQGLSKQPLISRALLGSVEAPVRFEADYKLAKGASSIDLDRLSANLFYADEQARISLRADSNVHVLTALGDQQSELGRVGGKVTLSVVNLTPEPFSSILAANGVSFTDVNGRAVLSSDGKSLNIDTIEPFRATGIAVTSNNKPVLNSFTLNTDIETIIQGDRLHAKVKQLNIIFDKDESAPALEANLDVILRGSGDTTWVDKLAANVNMALPTLLDQPAILPGHILTAGELTSVVTLDSSGKLESTIRVQGLKSKEALPLELLEIKLGGQVDDNGSFNLTAPISTRGESGESDLRLTAVHVNKQDNHNEITASVDSSVFYLNDILNTLNAISGKASNGEASTGEAEAELSEEEQAAIEAENQLREAQPDERAFWDTIPYNRHVTYNIKRLFYTDYLEIVDISGRAKMTADRLSLDEFKAYFHDSPLALNSAMTFTPGEKPYDLEMQASLDQFDLATFFRELDPDSIPRAEGLFDVKMDASGNSANMALYRNHLQFDMRMQSRDGVFRLLDANDALVTGASNFSGAVGEVVSYIPTGLFGLGAVARLVNYIKAVPYEKIDAHFVRDESGDVQIRKYVVQSPVILMTAKGGIDYKEGVDVMHSPLNMTAQLDLRDKGAAIFYDLDLLQDEKDPHGYWAGPEIKFWGTAAQTESNLGDIIEQAGKGAVLGGVTRPISGLIGNIRHLWMDEEDEPIDYDDTPQAAPTETLEETPTEVDEE